MQINPFYFRGPLFFLLVLLVWGDPSHSKISEEPVVNEAVLDNVIEQDDGPTPQRMKQILDSFRIPSKPPTGEPAVEQKFLEGLGKSFSEVKKLDQASIPIHSDSKPTAAEPDGEKLVKGTAKSFTEVPKLDQAPTLVESDSKPATVESDGEKLMIEGAAKSFSDFTKLGGALTPTHPEPAPLQKETVDNGKVDAGYVVEEQNEVSLMDSTLSPQSPSENNSKNGVAKRIPVKNFIALLEATTPKNAELAGDSASSLLPSIPLNFPVINGDMSIQERVEAIETLSDFLQGKALELSEFDMSALPGSKNLVKLAVDAIEEAYSKWIPQIISLMGTSLDHEELPLRSGSTDDHQEVDAEIEIQYQRRTQQKKRNAQEDPFEEEERKGQEEQDGRFNNHQSTNRFLKNHFGPKFDHVFKTRDALLSGDERHMKKLFTSLQNTHDHHAGGSSTRKHSRRTNVEDDAPVPVPFKLKQCKQLALCASKMSKYDRIVYYLSDDIDPSTGKFDESIFTYDEMRHIKSGVQMKAEQLLNPSNAKLESPLVGGEAISDRYTVGDACDDLLETFHRNVEQAGNVSHWEGGLVDQVCLAEGTAVYLDLADIALNVNFPLNFNYDGEDLAKTVSDTMFGCARELFYSHFRVKDERYKNEKYVFEQEGLDAFDDFFNKMTPPIQLPLPKRVLIPTNFATAEGGSRNMHGQLVNNYVPAFERAVLSSTYAIDVELPSRGTGGTFPVDASFALDLTPPYITLDQPFFCSKFSCAADYDCRRDNPPVYCIEESFIQTACQPEGYGITTCSKAKDGAACEKKCKDEKKAAYYDAITRGFDLVFGQRTSIGFICGIKERALVKTDGESPLPGYCCLDAPYQLDILNWGSAYTCDQDCTSYGPFFAGLSDEACEAHGGTFCPIADCTELKDCVEEYHKSAVAEDRGVFATYLETMPGGLYLRPKNCDADNDVDTDTDPETDQPCDQPKEWDPKNPIECGRVREYFGFDKDFVNEKQICEDIGQFQNTRDFLFIDEFLNQDFNVVVDPESTERPLVPPLILTPPVADPTDYGDTAPSNEAAVRNGQQWRGSNFALRKTVEAINLATDTIKGSECPCDPSCFIAQPCKFTKTFLVINSVITRYAIDAILDISEFTYGEKAAGDDRGPLQTAERIDAIYNNMDLTGQWMRARFISLGNYLDTIEDRLLRQLLPSRPSSKTIDVVISRRLAETSKIFPFNITYGGGCDDLDQDQNNVTDNCEEDQYPPTLSYSESLERKVVCPEKLCLNEYFQSQDDAQLFIEAVLHGIDDCAGPEDVRMDFQQSGECGETKFIVTPVQIFPNTSDCHGTKLPGESMGVMVGLDEVAPTVTCGFLPDPSETSLSSSIDGKTLHIQEGSSSFVDTAFYFDIQENCPSDVKVEVKVKTNEFTDDEKLVVLAEMQSLGSVEQVFLYVAPQSCAGNSSGSTICRQDPATPLRFYEIQVVAADKAGNKGNATCWVIVKPDGAGNSDRSFLSSNDLQNAVTNSTIRIPLSKLDLTWNNAVAPSEMPSSAPSISIQPSEMPSSTPSSAPSISIQPSEMPSSEPSISIQPSEMPSSTPSSVPSAVPSSLPSSAPSETPSSAPSAAKNVEYVGNDGSPTSAYPLGRCQGECDTNEDCEGDLICFQRDPGDPVPGCLGGEDDTSKNDFCISP